MIIKIQDFYSFLHQCQDNGLGGFKKVIVPSKTCDSDENNLSFSVLTENESFSFDSYRTDDPLKVLFYLPLETVLPANYSKMKHLIVGVKECDLEALAILDRALINEDFIDPSYSFLRDNTYIISSDCMAVGPTCHCTLVGGSPYASGGFDLNISRFDNYYLLTVGSSKGEELLKLMKDHVQLTEESPDNRGIVEKNRRKIVDELKERNREFEAGENYDSLKKSDVEKWAGESNQCVGCGGCTNICPTCYCMILNDETKAEEFIKVRSYDSCQLNGYARVAGGATPRPMMYQRFRNRYLCKFLYMKSNFDRLGCVGCGRCIDVCPGKIEFREVIKKNIEHSSDLNLETVKSLQEGRHEESV